MKPEELKKIAEAMGYDAEINEFEGEYVTIPVEYSIKGEGVFQEVDIFNPESNPAQLIEVIKWLLSCGYTIDEGENGYYHVRHDGIMVVYSSLLFEQAILQAALKQAEVL